MTPFILATALICGAGLTGISCNVNSADDVLHANVPRGLCEKAMQEVVAEREPPSRLRGEIVVIQCPPGAATASGGLTAADTDGAPPQMLCIKGNCHIYTPEEVARVTTTK